MRIDNVDAKQGKAIGYLVAVSIILTGVVGVLAYIESKRHSKTNDEILSLDKQIKTLELALKKNEAEASGVIG